MDDSFEFRRDEFVKLAEQGDWPRMERDALQLCDLQGAEYAHLMNLQNVDLAPRMAVVDLNPYVASLKAGLAASIARAKALNAPAVRFTIRFKRWDGVFLIGRVEPGNYVEKIEGPEMPALGALWAESREAPFHEDRMLLLIARTAGALARASEGIDRGSVALFAVFEDRAVIPVGPASRSGAAS
jgi:hypothetical protein